MKFLLLSCLISFSVNAGTTYVPSPTQTSAVVEADGFFRCGGDIAERVSSEATSLSCTVTDRTKCSSIFSESNCSKVTQYSYSGYADYRAKLLGKKVKYLGIAPFFAGSNNAELRVWVYVDVIPQ